jgi:tyrosine-protein phosphatase SIW14
MRTATIPLVLLALTASLPADAPRPRPIEWAQAMIGTSLENFYRVDEHLYRSGQPDREEMVEIAALGIRNVLNLRSYHDDRDEAEGLDLRLFQIATEADDISAEEIEDALEVIHRAEGPILVHCWHGSDRTGAVVAAYRMVLQGRTADEAWDEMLNGGYGLHPLFADHMRDVLFSLDVPAIRQRLGLTTE